MQVKVVKIGKYDPTANNMFSKFAGYELSTTQKIDLPVLPEGVVALQSKYGGLPPFDVLFHSTLLRGVQTAGCLPAQTHVPNADLNEVLFRLSELVTYEEFLKHSSVLVRERFVQSYIADTLSESRLQLYRRVTSVLAVLGTQEAERICLVSHSFFMKLLEATVLGANIWDTPELIGDYIKSDQKTYEFGEGFEFTM